MQESAFLSVVQSAAASDVEDHEDLLPPADAAETEVAVEAVSAEAVVLLSLAAA